MVRKHQEHHHPHHQHHERHQHVEAAKHEADGHEFESAAYRRLLSEFIGTFMLVLTVGCNVLSGSGFWAATSIAAMLTVSIYALGSVSGAHFNPAVTLAVTLCSNKLNWTQALLYILTQLSAGTAAGFTYATIFGKSFNLAPGQGYTLVEAGVVECLYTLMLCFVVLNVAVARSAQGRDFGGIAIGLVIVAGGYAGGSISGGALNPAVALGIDLSSANVGFGASLAYAGFEFFGAVLAAALFYVVRPGDFEEGAQVTLVGRSVSEFVGTYFLVLTVGLNVLTGSPAAAFSIAACLAAFVYALGDVSGGHFNPAVTVAVLLSGRGKLTLAEAGTYMCAQIAGGIAAGFTYLTLLSKTFPLGPVGSHRWASVAGVEITFTCLLCLVVLTVATSKASALPDMFGLAIGFCVMAGGCAAASISGGSLNPAVSFGIDTAHAAVNGGWRNCVVYLCFELVGAGVAAALFRMLHRQEFDDDMKLPTALASPSYGEQQALLQHAQ